jgi:hypothetical protein
MLLLLVACAPEPGTYLLETTAWSTTCAIAGGPYEEPAAQYQVEVYLEPDGGVWLEDVACERTELEYACADSPTEEAAGANAGFRVTREWTGAWSDPTHFTGDVAWETNCVGDGCDAVTVELCDATWSYAAVSVERAAE